MVSTTLRLAAAALAMLPSALAAQDEVRPPRIQPRSEQSPSEPTSINDWPQRIAAIDPGSRDEAWAKPDFDDRAWMAMTLPTHWEKAGLPDYDGVIWFRRELKLTAAHAEGEAQLALGAIDDMDVTWVNGKRVGGYEQPGDHYTPRNYRLPPGTLVRGRNVIAVRVMDHGWGGGLAETHGKMVLHAGGEQIALRGPWRYRPGASLAELMAWSQEPSSHDRPEPWRGKFELRDGDVVALAGGSGMVKQAESGYLETLLTAETGAHVAIRDVAWQADTVYRQQRPRNFGSQLDLLDRIHTTVIVANFGQMEALEGATRLHAFVEAYEKVLDELSQCTPRIILVPPHPFEKANNPHLPDLSARNGDVAAYAEAIRQLAERRGYLFADLGAFDPEGLTTDGVQLTPAGHRAWAEAVISQLLRRGTVYDEARLEPLREAVQHKNTLWRQHWRPTNWSFLYGNRQHVPSSHDHRPGKPRWFPREIDAIIPMIEEEEARIRTMQEEIE